jgi:drug/metabolite transporter (DMT)-like permease
VSIYAAILFKILSTACFAVMNAFARGLGETFPVGQVVFFRSFVGVLPVLVFYAWRRELWTALHTRRPMGHIARGLFGVAAMFCGFAALARLPIADVTAISFSTPLIIVALAGLLLGERVRIYRWSAVIIGLVGVLVMLGPHLSFGKLSVMGTAATLGAALAVLNAVLAAAAYVQIRRLTASETTSSIVLYFMLISSLAGLATLPLGWAWPDPSQLVGLVMMGVAGGIGQLFMTESYRYAPASLTAPFDYVSIIWAVLLGYFFFGEVPQASVWAGSTIVIAAGLFVIWRERQLSLERRREREVQSPAASP